MPKQFTIADLLLVELLRDMNRERYDDPDISSAQRTVLFREQSHTSTSWTTNRKNREIRVKSLTRFYEYFAQYEISPFHCKFAQR